MGGDPTPTLNLHKERQRTTGARTIRTSKSVLAALAIAISALPGPVRLPAQTLARPGWVGSGLTAQTWFKHAILYQIDTRTFSDSNTDGTGDLKGITQHLDYIHSLGVDAILLRPLAPSGGPLNTVDPALGTLDDFDDLTLQASRLKIRILLELPAADPSLARFWLTRGVAGFYVPGNASPNLPAIDAIRKLLPTYVGQRVLITDADIAATSTASKSNELILDRATLNSTPNPVPMLRTALEQSQALIHTATPILAIDRPAAPDTRLARLLATATLLNRSASLITAGQELGFTPASGSTALIPWGQPAAAAVDESPEPAKPPAPVVAAPDKYTPYVPYVRPAAPKKPSPPDPATAAGQEANPNSLLNFYRHLSRLHHGTSALRDGEEITFNHDDREALIWMRKPASPSQANPPVLVACNFSDKPLVLSLKADVTHIQLHGNFLRTILRSDDLMGGVSLDPLTLPPFGVYIGELRY